MNNSPSLGEMMQVWFAQMVKAIEALNQTTTLVLQTLQDQGKGKDK